MKKLTAEWIEKTEEDFFSVTHLAGAGRLTPYNVICFHCQQAGEKWLKARLCEDGVVFPKTHDLRALGVRVQILTRLSRPEAGQNAPRLFRHPNTQFCERARGRTDAGPVAARRCLRNRPVLPR